MKRYSGHSLKGQGVVEVNDGNDVRPLQPRPDLEGVKLATGFGWGYGGSGPKQLAIALLADAISDEVARDWHLNFLKAKIEPLGFDKPWAMTDEEIVNWWKATSPGWSAPRRN